MFAWRATGKLRCAGQSTGQKKIVAATKRAVGSIAPRMLMHLTLSRPHREIVSNDEY
jgi:hypothetical protein